MKIKPKEVLINMPVVLMFETEDKINEFAANVNTILHGKVKVKCEELGKLGEQYVGLFYLQRNGEYHELRETFLNMIETEEIFQTLPSSEQNKDLNKVRLGQLDNDLE